MAIHLLSWLFSLLLCQLENDSTWAFPLTAEGSAAKALALRKATALPNQGDANVNKNLMQNGRWTIQSVLEQQGLAESIPVVLRHLKDAGFATESALVFLARDFAEHPHVFSSLLMSDFDFPPLVAHQTRAIAMELIRYEQAGKTVHFGSPCLSPQSHEQVTSAEKGDSSDKETTVSDQRRRNNGSHIQNNPPTLSPQTLQCPKVSIEQVVVNKKSQGRRDNGNSAQNNDPPTIAPPTLQQTTVSMKQVIVNEKSRQRRKQAQEQYEYALSGDYGSKYPLLADEMDAFYQFMTQPSTNAQEDPILPATATTYLKHAKLFLGWYVARYENATDVDSETDDAGLSLFRIIPSKDKESASTIIDYILWLRKTRNISVSYEANLLRGMIKLLKYRFAKESQSDASYGGISFDDIPMIKEVRKLHRSANAKTKVAPRSSNEQLKWISWPEYLQVVEQTKKEVLQLKEAYRRANPDELKYRKDDAIRHFSVEQERIAEAYQRYLILAIFANIPDRQRTVREMEIGRTLVKNNENGCWMVKHGPDDYKTGKSYGERPTMQLNEELTPAVDDFIENWRPALLPKTDILFAQSRTGAPLTTDGIFSRVSRSCFKYSGKRTNPHLLRDMIVTHVRESNASERELEALALYMGHSLQTQRSSYDRRTLTSKIAPAVKLMQTVNSATKHNEWQ